MTSNEIRASFLKYFEQNGHRVVPSSPLVPHDDPTLLFTNAGMNQFKDVFLGREKRAYTRAASSQKCMRVSGKHNDLDNVGPSLRHHTFFEMLGNFSFGDYFKKDAIAFAWSMLTDVWKMPPDRLVVSIFKGENGIPRDAEAHDIWRQFVPADRILELGAEDNFWQMGETGPCGRCSEIYYVRGGGAEPEIEIWNNVFMEFERGAGGTLTPLPAPSIDTGMGLERVTAVLQEKESNYDTDLFKPILARIGQLAGVRYGADERTSIAMRVVADHIRATTFLIADGVMPSNEKRGYVLRKIMRRAMRHGRHLGLTDPFMSRLVEGLAHEMGDAYPELRTSRAMIETTILAEEKQFEAVLTEGLPRLEAELAKVVGTKSRQLPGEAAFRLYDTFGVPYEFIDDTADAQGVTIDVEGYERAMQAQRDKARAGSSFGDGAKGDEFAVGAGMLAEELKNAGDQFEGYTTVRMTGVPVLALFNEQRQPIATLAAGQTGYVTLARTPFYLESGGQVSDSGRIISDASGASAIVDGLTRVRPGLPRAHRVRVESGTLRGRDLVTAEVDAGVRDATRRNHTATHLLHAALREVLGPHVKQAGSLVAPDRLRFDFVHVQPLTRDELDRIERIVNEQIYRNTPVTTEVRSTTEAIAAGAMALFGEKYGDSVRVVSVPGFSMELCGGTHVRATGDIGFFVIVAESGVAAGTRRIEALTGAAAVAWAQHKRATMNSLLDVLHTGEDRAVETAERLQAAVKRLEREVSQATLKAALTGLKTAISDVDISGITLARHHVSGLQKEALRGLVDAEKARLKTSAVIVAANSGPEGAATVVVSITPDLKDRLSAGSIVRELAPMVGGRGGGRSDFAEAGGKNPEKIAAMLEESPRVIESLLKTPGA